MASDASSALWIGTPQRGRTQEDVANPYTSKIGGRAACFRVGNSPTERLDAAALTKYFQCPQCKSSAQVSLVSQIYAPVSVYDRVLYVLTCAACTRRPAASPSGSAPAPAPTLPPGASKRSGLAATAAAKSFTSFCFAVRSQNFSQDYFLEMQQEQQKAVQQSADAQKGKTEKETPLFAEAEDDWGDDDDGQAPLFAAPTSPASASKGAVTARTGAESGAAPVAQEEVCYPVAEQAEVAVAVKGRLYTDGVPLDLYVVPPHEKGKELSMEEQLAAAERMYGDNAAVDTSGFEEDDETPAEECVREYMEAMEAAPSQCVRWCLGGVPLRTSLSAIGANGATTIPPPCPACGAPRQFEMQLTAPTVYFLTKEIGEAKNATLHFSNVLVYTCRDHCYGGGKSNSPYLPEYVVVEDEL